MGCGASSAQPRRPVDASSLAESRPSAAVSASAAASTGGPVVVVVFDGQEPIGLDFEKLASRSALRVASIRGGTQASRHVGLRE
eukprot:COSAG01_NODE_54700_length_330_cov_0.883117_1_plen_83_part_10